MIPEPLHNAHVLKWFRWEIYWAKRLLQLFRQTVLIEWYNEELAKNEYILSGQVPPTHPGRPEWEGIPGSLHRESAIWACEPPLLPDGRPVLRLIRGGKASDPGR